MWWSGSATREWLMGSIASSTTQGWGLLARCAFDERLAMVFSRIPRAGRSPNWNAPGPRSARFHCAGWSRLAPSFADPIGETQFRPPALPERQLGVRVDGVAQRDQAVPALFDPAADDGRELPNRNGVGENGHCISRYVGAVRPGHCAAGEWSHSAVFDLRRRNRSSPAVSVRSWSTPTQRVTHHEPPTSLAARHPLHGHPNTPAGSQRTARFRTYIATPGPSQSEPSARECDGELHLDQGQRPPDAEPLAGSERVVRMFVRRGSFHRSGRNSTDVARNRGAGG